jgi:hypothetical protein
LTFSSLLAGMGLKRDEQGLTCRNELSLAWCVLGEQLAIAIAYRRN